MQISNDNVVFIPALSSEETEKLHLQSNAKGCVFEPDYTYIQESQCHYAQNKRIGDANPRYDDWDANYDENTACLHPVNVNINYIDWDYIEE